MISAAYLEKLLDGHEPQLTALGEIGTFIRGSGIQKSDFTESGAGCIHYGQIHTHYGTWATETKSFITHEFAARLRKAHTGDLVVATTSEDDDAVAKAVAWPGAEAVAVSTDAYIYRHAANPKYMSYFFQTEFFQSQKKPHITGTKVRRISGDSLAKIQIPIPCPDNPKKSLEIQAEIVRILDTFTELNAELNAELTAREKQYNHYRDQLLSFEEGDVEWKTLGEVCDFKNGFAFKSNLFRDAGQPIVRITNINGSGVDMADVKYFDPADYKENTLSYVIENGDILIAMSGATTGKIGRFNSNRAAYLNQRVGKFIPKNSVLSNRYLYHFLISKTDSIYVLAGGGAQPNLSSKALMEKILIPIPYSDDSTKSMAEQKRIANILDKLDTLTNSITEGLPREIALRQKQYEYYRDLLLSFPKPEEVAA